MSERKVLNKYYPPDFDPSKIPRIKQPKNRKFTVRLMAPFNMRCTTCGEYIYKGKKFNARKEDVENEDYLGIRIYRFYIKCTRCLSEIAFKTDPQNTDYVIEAGATRNFQALKLAEEAAEREYQEQLEEEKSNPMKLLEKRTKASKHEMEMLEALEELKELSQRHSEIDYDAFLGSWVHPQHNEQEEDEILIQQHFGKNIIKRIADDASDDDITPKKQVLLQEIPETKVEEKSVQQSWRKSIGSLPHSSQLGPLIKTKHEKTSSCSAGLSLLNSYNSDSEDKLSDS